MLHNCSYRIIGMTGILTTAEPAYPLLDFQSVRSCSVGGLGITRPDLLDTRTFSPSSVYMYLTRQGLLVREGTEWHQSILRSKENTQKFPFQACLIFVICHYFYSVCTVGAMALIVSRPPVWPRNEATGNRDQVLCTTLYYALLVAGNS